MPIPQLSVKMVFGGPHNAPYIAFIIETAEYKTDNCLSFTVPFNQLTYYSDAYQVYMATQRGYQSEMRNFQTLNNIVSGVVGGVNQGAMIAAFSRTQIKSQKNPTGLDGGLNKGLIGGGIGIAGAIGMGVYQYVYANKEAQRIEDSKNRNTPDTMIMSGEFPRPLMTNAGIYEVKYDSVAIQSIQTFQTKFGYATNTIGTDVALNSLTGYVQADVIFYNSLRIEIESYIKDMFNYGVTFTTFT